MYTPIAPPQQMKMLQMMLLLCVKRIIFISFVLISHYSFAVDIIKTVSPASDGGKSTQYKSQILLRALQLTEPEYGSFIIKDTSVNMKPLRAMLSISSGKMMNVAFMAANEEWDNKALPIAVPIRGGTLSYRLLLVNKANLDDFAKVSSLADLNMLIGGLQNDWSTTKIFKASNINIRTPQTLEGMLSMLNVQRIDYIPRAIYEIFDEIKLHNNSLKNVVIEPTLSLYIPMVSYAYVSPKAPRIAQRLKIGLDELARSGELRRIFNQYYGQDIQNSGLTQRKVIKISSPYFEKNKLSVADLWNLH